jgi:hypothetical protein
VFDRFGDPAAVARRLWLDVLKGKIMAQRILIATCVVATAASLALAGVMWQRSIQMQFAVTRAHQEAILAREQAESAQREMLKRLSDVSAAIETTRSLDWNPVTFVVTEETPDGPPVAGTSISFHERDRPFRGTGMGGGGGMLQEPPKPALRQTDSSGVADFGVAHPGDYSYRIVRGWDQGSVLAAGELRIEPGSRIRQRVVCPKLPPARQHVRIHWEWPADLARQQLVLYAVFVANPIQQDGVSWTRTDIPLADILAMAEPSQRLIGMGTGVFLRSSRSILCGPGTHLAEVTSYPRGSAWRVVGEDPREIRVDFRASDPRPIQEPAERLQWESGGYRLVELWVMRPDEQADVKDGANRFQILCAIARSDQFGGGYYWNVASRTVARAELPAQRLVMGGGFAAVSVRAPDFWLKPATSFDAQSGQANDWTIPLPDELIAAVREKLKN